MYNSRKVQTSEFRDHQDFPEGTINIEMHKTL